MILVEFHNRLINISYLNHSLKESTVEEIEQMLNSLGLSDEQIVKMGERFTHSHTQQYILENGMLSGINNTLTWVLGLIAFYLIILLFAAFSHDNTFMKTDSVSYLIFSSITCFNRLVPPRNGYHHSLFRRNWIGRIARRSKNAGAVSPGSRSV